MLIRDADAARRRRLRGDLRPLGHHGVASLEEVAPDAGRARPPDRRRSRRGYPWLIAELDGVIAGYAYA